MCKDPVEDVWFSYMTFIQLYSQALNTNIIKMRSTNSYILTITVGGSTDLRDLWKNFVSRLYYQARLKASISSYYPTLQLTLRLYVT